MKSDESSKNQNSADVTDFVPPRLFPLAKQEPTPFEKQRALIGLFKQGPLETVEEFAQRVWQGWQEHQADEKAAPKTGLSRMQSATRSITAAHIMP